MVGRPYSPAAHTEAVELVAQSAGGGFPFLDVARALVVAIAFSVPLGITVWALLDAARRPQWAWALAERRQVVWLALILAGGLSVVGGLVISGWYLTKVRPVIRAVEDGDLGGLGDGG